MRALDIQFLPPSCCFVKTYVFLYLPENLLIWSADLFTAICFLTICKRSIKNVASKYLESFTEGKIQSKQQWQWLFCCCLIKIWGSSMIKTQSKHRLTLSVMLWKEADSDVRVRIWLSALVLPAVTLCISLWKNTELLQTNVVDSVHFLANTMEKCVDFTFLDELYSVLKMDILVYSTDQTTFTYPRLFSKKCPEVF